MPVPRSANPIATIASTGIVKRSLDLAAVTEMDETDRTGDFAPWEKIVSSRDATPVASGSYAPAQLLPFTLDTGMLHSPLTSSR